MVDPSGTQEKLLPLHELIAQIITAKQASLQKRFLIPSLGTMQSLNRALVHRPALDFINSILRGIGQVIFVNNPVSGALILSGFTRQIGMAITRLVLTR